jgi:A/G-specific adenine glycosylase
MKNATDTFLQTLFDFYTQNARSMPWRLPDANGAYDPYHILVSEFMLQQTQVERVIPKYNAFISAFPSCEALSRAPLDTVFEIWTGLGYNRRALYLRECASNICANGFPDNSEDLVGLKGIGHNTAAAILTYAFNQRHVFVETNIRTVLIHHFFKDAQMVTDAELLYCLEGILRTYKGSYRDFYWAMMDYGTWLKKSGIKTHVKSSTYKKQSRFKGSRRQIRGEVLRQAQKQANLQHLEEHINDSRFHEILQEMTQEGFIEVEDGRVKIRNV